VSLTGGRSALALNVTIVASTRIDPVEPGASAPVGATGGQRSFWLNHAESEPRGNTLATSNPLSPRPGGAAPPRREQDVEPHQKAVFRAQIHAWEPLQAGFLVHQ
jgi:hypothetical protein